MRWIAGVAGREAASLRRHPAGPCIRGAFARGAACNQRVVDGDDFDEDLDEVLRQIAEAAISLADRLSGPITAEVEELVAALVRTASRAIDHARLHVELFRRQQSARAGSNDAPEALLASLTLRERQAFELITEGLTNRQIGQRLGIAEKTVKNYVSGLLAKLGMQHRSQVAAFGATLRAQRASRA